MKKRLRDEQEARSTARETLDVEEAAAFDRIYQRYGSDLAAFFRDAHNEVAAKALEKCANKTEACP